MELQTGSFQLGMIRQLSAALVLAVGAVSAASAQPVATGWNPAQVGQLKQWVQDAPRDALPLIAMPELEAALAAQDQPAIDRAATALALRLARMHLLGCATPAERSGWNIADASDAAGLEARLAAAVAAQELDRFIAGLRPHHPDYARLRAALASETDPAKRTTLSRNMERWRWMPLDLGKDYVLVNTARFEASLWRGSARVGTWPVIVGKPQTPSPVFAATITGVTFNPWWEIPASIVRESVGSLVRRNPALARKRGYVWGGGSYRQRPGPGNALGQMKLAMANPYNVYLHDTPSKQLFTQDVRAFSHGCIRVGDAIGFAATLAEGVRTRAEVDAIVASGKTTLVSIQSPLPIYITYFTASADSSGTVAILPDIYGRDQHLAGVGTGQRSCGN